MKPSLSTKNDGGFSLVEIALALGVVGFCLSALLGLLVVGLSANNTAASQSTANNILAAVVADLRATKRTAPSAGAPSPSPLYQITVPQNPTIASAIPPLYLNPDGSWSTSLQQDSTHRLVINFLANPAGARSGTFVDLKLNWPAGADSNSPAGSVETFVALDRN